MKIDNNSNEWCDFFSLRRHSLICWLLDLMLISITNLRIFYFLRVKTITRKPEIPQWLLCLCFSCLLPFNDNKNYLKKNKKTKKNLTIWLRYRDFLTLFREFQKHWITLLLLFSNFLFIINSCAYRCVQKKLFTIDDWHKAKLNIVNWGTTYIIDNNNVWLRCK